MNYLVKTHKPGMSYKGPHFFVLSRGKNTGKVLTRSCPNCWVISAQDDITVDRLKGIVTALHITHAMRYMLIGSVIEYVRITDFRKLLKTYTDVIKFDEKWDKDLQAIQSVVQLRDNYMDQRRTLELMLSVRYYNLIRGI
jgi:hypothetical protein